MTVDLHSHTTASDGLLAPAELLAAAAAAKIDVLAVTDHDTIDGISAARVAAEKLPSLTLIPGIEITCWVNQTEIHVLGLGIRPETPGLTDWLARLMEERVNRLQRMAEQLARIGIVLDISEFLAPSRIGSVGRPHIARLLIAGGHAKDMEEAFQRYLVNGRPGHVERLKLSAADAIRRVHEAGGVAIQAHPGQMGKDEDLPQLLDWGLDGLEVFHPDHTPAMKHRYAHIVDDRKLIATGGSDFHGDADHHGHGSRLNAKFGTPASDWQRITDRIS